MHVTGEQSNCINNTEQHNILKCQYWMCVLWPQKVGTELVLELLTTPTCTSQKVRCLDRTITSIVFWPLIPAAVLDNIFFHSLECKLAPEQSCPHVFYWDEFSLDYQFYSDKSILSSHFDKMIEACLFYSITHRCTSTLSHDDDDDI